MAEFERAERMLRRAVAAEAALDVLATAAEGVLNDGEGEPRKVLRQQVRSARRLLETNLVETDEKEVERNGY